MEKFNAEQFMQTEIEQVGETEYTPIPEDEYQAVIKGIEGDSTPKGKAFLKVIWIIDDQGVKDLLDNDEPTARQTIWLDMTEAGTLEFGKNKNIGLSRLREALGQNTGKAWSPSMLLGQVATVNIKHRIAEDGGIFAEVKGVRA